MQTLDYFIGATIYSEDAQIFKGLLLRYGPRLERLDFESKLGLRATLTRYRYCKHSVDNYAIRDAIYDTFFNCDADICTILLSLQGLSDQGVDLLVELAQILQNDSRGRD